MDLLESNGLKSLGLKSMRLKSRGFNSVKCKFCEKVFSNKEAESMCARHERTHTGEKPFICKLCEKAFSRKDYLTRHEHMVLG